MVPLMQQHGLALAALLVVALGARAAAAAVAVSASGGIDVCPTATWQVRAARYGGVHANRCCCAWFHHSNMFSYNQGGILLYRSCALAQVHGSISATVASPYAAVASHQHQRPCPFSRLMDI